MQRYKVATALALDKHERRSAEAIHAASRYLEGHGAGRREADRSEEGNCAIWQCDSITGRADIYAVFGKA
jgi:hypothetical protein